MQRPVPSKETNFRSEGDREQSESVRPFLWICGVRHHDLLPAAILFRREGAYQLQFVLGRHKFFVPGRIRILFHRRALFRLWSNARPTRKLLGQSDTRSHRETGTNGKDKSFHKLPQFIALISHHHQTKLKCRSFGISLACIHTTALDGPDFQPVLLFPITLYGSPELEVTPLWEAIHSFCP
jgi:hypothetical protein